MKITQEINDANVIILEADGKVDERNGYGYLIQKRLKECDISSVKLYLPDIAHRLETLPPKPMIISGGMTEVTREINWINNGKKFINKVIEGNRKSEQKKASLFGICFGAQLIAESYREGSVKYLDNPEIGNTKVIIENQHPLFKGYKEDFLGYTFHYNQILPLEEFDILSTTKHLGNHFIQAFEIPKANCFGVQFHPEFLYEEFLVLMKTYKTLIEQELKLDYNIIIKNIKKIDSNAKLLRNFVEQVTNG